MELDTLQINRILTAALGRVFYGTIPIDKLPKRPLQLPFAVVINTSPAKIKKGHWVCLYINKNKVGCYACPYGTKPYGAIARFLLENTTFSVYSMKLLQNPVGNLCGYYVIYLLSQLNIGKKLGDVIAPFSTNFILNDRIIISRVHSIARNS